MIKPNKIKDQINEHIASLTKAGLADDQMSAFRRRSGNFDMVTFQTADYITVALRNRPYYHVYRTLVQKRAFNIKMLDGALIQMMYRFSHGSLQSHRLAFFPSPYLLEFQNDPDRYTNDRIDGDVVSRNRVPFPFRFDHDVREGRFMKLAHPKSHLTLGQYEHCRIPVSAPVTPHWFIDFILRNFYDTPQARYSDSMPVAHGDFAESILDEERKVIHVMIPA